MIEHRSYAQNLSSFLSKKIKLEKKNQA